MQKSKPVRYTTRKGNDWIAWIDWESHMAMPPNYPAAHSIEFSDGSVFDMANGWRPKAAADPLEEAHDAIDRVCGVQRDLWPLEKIELAARRTAIQTRDSQSDWLFRTFADEIVKIIKDHRP